MSRGSPLRFLLPLLLLFPLAGTLRSETTAATPASSQASQTLPAAASADRNAAADTSLANSSKSRTDSVIVVKHSFEHREQIIAGSVVMSCLMLMMVAMNNYNPR
jgi:hypothetical protein